MPDLENTVSRNWSIFKNDITKHLVYTVLIVFVSSITTFLLYKFFISQEFKTLVYSVPIKEGTIIFPKPDEALYTERGSPYDNRTVGTKSADVIFHGPRDKKQIALTFDAEMTDRMRANVISGKVSGSYDKRIVDILDKTHTKATFFLTGMWIEMYPDITRQLSDDPLFELGSHSYSDTAYSGFCYGLQQISSTVKIEEIGSTEKLLREHAGIDNRLFRFPGGCYTPEDVSLVHQANDTVVHWDVVGADGFNNNASQIVRNVVDNTQNGSIVVLHANGVPTAPKTAEALPAIISALKAKGFEFVKVSELLGLPPALKAGNF